MIDDVIASLEKQLASLANQPANFMTSYEKSWLQMMLANAHYLKYKANTKDMKSLETAKDYSLEFKNQKYKGWIDQDTTLLKLNGDFTDEYQSMILREGQPDEIIEFLAGLTFQNPINENYNSLKRYQDSLSNVNFRTYWHSYLKSKFQVMQPETIEKINTEMPDFLNQNKWTLIDFWGTWCVPCVAEMPDFVDFIEMNQSNTHLVVTTIARDTKSKVEGFLEKRGYDFPVIIDEQSQIINDFGVIEYPSKVLISPDNRFFLIPNGSTSWKHYVQSFVGSGVIIKRTPTHP